MANGNLNSYSLSILTLGEREEVSLLVPLLSPLLDSLTKQVQRSSLAEMPDWLSCGEYLGQCTWNA